MFSPKATSGAPDGRRAAGNTLVNATPPASCRDGAGCPNSRIRVPSWSPSAKACFHCQSKTESGNLGKSR